MRWGGACKAKAPQPFFSVIERVLVFIYDREYLSSFGAATRAKERKLFFRDFWSIFVLVESVLDSI